ncbi:MAG TPA: hypothetical protein VFA59_17175 [Vicinamibacterales bacterium]|nr:hypothetical protein [Vicinamibacterales bacterium]
MRLEELRRYEMLTRVDDFGVSRAEQFPADSVGGQLFGTVHTIVHDAKDFVVANISSRSAARERTSIKGKAYRALRTAMLAVSRTSRAVAFETPALDDKFRMPDDHVDQNYIHTARSFVQDATPHADRFVAHGLPQTFLADLTAKTDAFERVILDHAAAKESRAAAGVGVSNTIATGFAAAKRLDAVVKNQFAGDPETLAAWKAARRVSRLGLTYPPKEQPAPAPTTVKPAA